uniref:Fibronectin type-III domain-containing protein n=1 Tax=Amphimedon queenslandica TaxID=400682 RepID=A0A1X7VPZ7_AMPQE
INSINWTLVSSITQLNNTQYCIDCLTTTDIYPSTDIYWLVNGVMKMNWTTSSETNGYVIEYTTGGVTRNVVSINEDEIVLTDLSPMSTYTISVYSYIDLPSVNSTVRVLRIDVPSSVTSLSVSNVSTTGITVSWTIPSSDNYVTYYTISYTPSCPQLSSVNETVSVGPHQSTTTYSYTLIGLYSGMNYTITVRAGNVLGGSDKSMGTSAQTEAMSNDTYSFIPSGWPSSIQVLPVNSTANRFTWNEVDCSERNGLITGYTVIISNSSITYNLTSTERYIILNDLVFGTEYNISVAAVNSAGRGPFSDPIEVEIGIGIYLRHDGNCYPNVSYFWDNTVNAANEAISCVLPGTSLTTGQWVRVADPNDDPVDCNSNSDNDPFRCTNVTSPTAINLYLAQGLPAAQEGWYKCCLPTDCSDPNTNIIFANIFRFAEIESFTADLPSDMTVYPQEYKLSCTKIGHSRYGISMSIGSTAPASYTNCDDDDDDNCPGTELDSITNRIRYTADITWDGMTVSSGSISQSTTGDQMYQCVLDNPSAGDDRTRTLTIKVPATAPSSLTEVSKTATTITVSWTALDSSDADGYVVNVTSDTDTVQTVQVEGSSNNTITLNGLGGGTTYNITVRAYQQLLGPASNAISVFTHCQQEGIYLAHNGNCYPNGSYSWDSSVNAVTEAISCVLPGTSLTTGQWVRVADPDDPVDCNSNSASDPFRCTNVTSPDATISLYLAQGLSAAQEGWYKCCLPTDCSDPNTNIIFANIFRFAEIESFTVADLPSDMTVYPQEYKLNCTKIGFYQYGISMSIGSTALANYTNCEDRYTHYCPGTVLVSSTFTIRYTVTITWDGMTVSSGSISQSTTGDQMYQCRVADHPDANAIRIRNVTIK